MNEQLINDQKIIIMKLACHYTADTSENFEERYKKMIDLVTNYKPQTEKS